MSPADEAQAALRACRICQKKPFFVHKLVVGILADADISNLLDEARLRALLKRTQQVDLRGRGRGFTNDRLVAVPR